ncbi:MULTISPECIES: hypothetical protein [unclassified Pedobacter]|uniref:hypothetical protein n=1 Tax=unclassified Pedobacter TaxID=2628915 RepID=UPI00141EBB9D|nr:MULTISPECIES: hypothetical protein [unclassified Pedobacter]NII81711.1 hypothetical protein [Pedobacter sp. SG908]NMN35715.1 hypothetical protein [Pedobacter sp. SG918]
MTEDNLKEILAMPEINATGIAKKLYGDKPTSRSRLNDKVANRKSGNGHQRLTDDDLAKASAILQDLAKAITDRL